MQSVVRTAVNRLAGGLAFTAAVGFAVPARTADLLTSPVSSYTYSGALIEAADTTPGGSLTRSSINVPVAIAGQQVPFEQHASATDTWGYSTSRYDLELDSALYPAFDVLTLQVQIGISGTVHGLQAPWHGFTTNLSGAMTTTFAVQQWSTADIDLEIAWGMSENGGPFESGAEAGINVVTVRGPLEPDPAQQTAYLLEKVLPLPATWLQESVATSQSLHNLVPGTYEVVIVSELDSEGYALSTETTSYGMDIGNIVAVQVTQTLTPGACLPGLPCASAADRDQMNGVKMNDFAAWYDEPADVNSDGVINGSDVAVMAWLLAVPTADADQNGVVDAVDAWRAIAAVETPAAMKAAQLHPARPNPFNPATVLSFTLPTDARVDLAVYDLMGRRVRTLVAGESRAAGRHEMAWDGCDQSGQAVAAGVYVYRLEAGAEVLSGRMALVK
jgi:hypothetical protein